MLDLLNADYTFVNERLARHYGITERQRRRVPPRHAAGVSPRPARSGQHPDAHLGRRPHLAGAARQVGDGSAARHAATAAAAGRAGAGRIGEGASPAGKRLSTRQRMEEHRNNPICNSCHRVIDPLGLALDNFDVTGAWRIKDNEVPVDVVGDLYDGTRMDGPAGLRDALMKHQDMVLRSFTENLMTYALGRRLEYHRHAGGARRSSTPPPRRTTASRRSSSASSRIAAFRMSETGGKPTADNDRGKTGGAAAADVGRALTAEARAQAARDPRSHVMFSPASTCPARTVLKGMGVTMALPLLDAMSPAVSRASAARGAKNVRLVAIEMVHGSAGSTRSASRRTCGRRRRPAPRSTCAQQPQAARALPRRHHHHQQHRRAQRRGVHDAGDWRRPLPLERGVPDPGAPEADAGLRRVRRHFAGPDVRAAASGRTRRSRRCSCASRTWISPAAVPTAIRAPTPIRSAGRRRRSRCRWCATRAWCSTRCSASAPRPASGASGAPRTRACSTGSRRRSAR